MSSLYYQHRQHEQQQQQQQRLHRYHAQDAQHEVAQSHSHHQERHPHHSQPTYSERYHYAHQEYHQSQYNHRNQDKIPTPEHEHEHDCARYPLHASPHSQAAAYIEHHHALEEHLRSSFRQTREELLDTLAAKISLECKNYCLDSYFPPEVLPPNTGLPRQQNVIRGAWREKICQWSYNVVDHYKLPREIVSISLNYFDRYMATLSTAEGSIKQKVLTDSASGNESGDLALLASLGTLHLATKVHLTNHNDYDPELGPLEEQHYKIPSLQSLATLSRGQFGAESIVEMEKLLLRALDWKLHPPTLFALMNSLLDLIPTLEDDPVDGLKKSIRDELFEASMYLAELSVCDVFFVERQIPSSTIALASICTAMENLMALMSGFEASHLRGSGCFSEHHRRRFLDTCSDRLRLGCRTARDQTQFQQALERLLAIHKGAEENLSFHDVDVEADVTSPTTPLDEVQQRCRSDSYNPPTSPSSIADMSMSTSNTCVNSCIHSMAETTIGEREGCNPNLKRGDSMSVPTRSESMVSSIVTRTESMVSSIDCHTTNSTIRTTSSSMITNAFGTPDCGDYQTSSCNNSNNFRYSPSPPSNGDHEAVCEPEDPRIADFRRRVEASLVVSSDNGSDHYRSDIYHEVCLDEEHLQLQDDSYRKKRTTNRFLSNANANGSMMSCSPIVALR